jgi:hypothetical protein
MLKPTSLYIGSWMRFNDAIIPYLGLEFDDFRLGITYDYNTSSLKTASQNKGGIEISLIYIHRPSTDRPVNCPKLKSITSFTGVLLMMRLITRYAPLWPASEISY